MSSASSRSSDVTSVSYSFVLNWSLKGKDLNSLKENNAKGKAIRSDLYHFKIGEELQFYLEMISLRYNYLLQLPFAIEIKGSKMWSFELAYAFLVIKEKTYTLKASSQLSFLTPFFHNNIPDEDDVPIHCVVIADPVFKAPSANKDDVFPMEGQNIIDIDCRSDITLPEYYSNKMVIDFIRRGNVPDFDVKKAIKIISEASQHNCEVLKIICVEYLMRNITAESIKDISRAAIDYQLPVLERNCMQQIAWGNIKTAK